MTPAEKVKKIKEIEQRFLDRIDAIKRDYQKKVKAIMSEVDKKKIEKVKKDLGL
ncbi:MAG: hypothetical protein K0S38_198 [Candidatus Paceibacter sp.]|jgi:hypothetical protein|nr:hypothetical protein [Candidatus Paceibacter sp.]